MIIIVPEFLLAVLINSGTSFALDCGEIQAALLANGVAIISFVWRHEKLASTHDVCQGLVFLPFRRHGIREV